MRTTVMPRHEATMPPDVFERRLEELERVFDAAARVRRQPRRDGQVAALNALAEKFRRAFPPPARS